MHKNRWNSSEFLIELPQVKFNPDDFLGFVDRYEFNHYINAYGKPTPQEVCYNKSLLVQPIVQHYLNVFKDFDLKLGHSAHSEGTGLNGWQLIRSDMSENGLALHIDAKRPTCITFPLTFPQSVNYHESKDSGITDTYEYTPTIVILNSGSKWHSVSKSTEPRLQFQFDCYNSWEEIKELVKNIK
jgi:hypothetical protein|tara:strand:- start:9 stop:563 length:555 start_codon:yes stop_codon:yes gene_type:complete